jgi:hypothetical protein
LDKDLSRKLQPRVTIDGVPVEYYRPAGRVPPTHSELIFSAEGKPTTRLAIKLSPNDLLAAIGRSIQVHIERDLRLPALVSLLKAAHLTMFEMVGYEYGLSAGGHFVGHEILGRFFLENRGEKKPVITERANSHFRQFANLVRPVQSAPSELRGTASDRFLYLCTSSSGAWAFVILVRTGEQMHAVLLPVMEDPDNAARFVAFLENPAPRFEVRLTRFAGDHWEGSPEPQTFIWPEARFE